MSWGRIGEVDLRAAELMERPLQAQRLCRHPADFASSDQALLDGIADQFGADYSVHHIAQHLGCRTKATLTFPPRPPSLPKNSACVLGFTLRRAAAPAGASPKPEDSQSPLASAPLLLSGQAVLGPAPIFRPGL